MSAYDMNAHGCLRIMRLYPTPHPLSQYSYSCIYTMVLCICAQPILPCTPRVSGHTLPRLYIDVNKPARPAPAANEHVCSKCIRYASATLTLPCTAKAAERIRQYTCTNSTCNSNDVVSSTRPTTAPATNQWTRLDQTEQWRHHVVNTGFTSKACD